MSIFQQYKMIPAFEAARLLNDRLGGERCWFTFLTEDRRSRRSGHHVSFWRDPETRRIFYKLHDLESFIEAVKQRNGSLPKRPKIRDRG